MRIAPRRHSALAGICLCLTALTLAAAMLWLINGPQTRGEPSTSEAPRRLVVDETYASALCGYCHRFPQPEVLPRSAWRHSVLQMAEFPLFGKNVGGRVDTAAVAAWYEARAPEELPLITGPAVPDADSLPLRVRRFSPAGAPDDPAAANVRFVDLLGDARLEIVACDMKHGSILMGRPYESGTEFLQIATVPNPAHAEIVDLDKDGRRDLLVANLGSYLPLDHNLGTVEWLRQADGERFDRVTLYEGLGRVADVRPVDFDGDGDLDLTVAEFGWRATGRVLVLENRTTDWSNPQFELRIIDARHGSIHVPVADLDGDGRPDFVALLAQDHEMVVAYLNRGGFRFEKQLLYQAPHPAWGSSGMQLVDFDGDDDLDVLLTNGDTFDDNRAKPYHGIGWLENRGGLRFEPHRLATMYGVHRAQAADLDGDGDLDVAACAFVDWRQRPDVRYVGLLWLEQTEPGRFVEHVLAAPECRHATLDLGDYDGDGDVDLVTGNAALPGDPLRAAVTLWENLLR